MDLDFVSIRRILYLEYVIITSVIYSRRRMFRMKKKFYEMHTP